MELPHHRDSGEPAESGPNSDSNRAARILVGVLIAVVVLVVMLHLSGVVDPSGH